MLDVTKCRRGSIAIAFSLALVPLAAAVGATVDYTRAIGGRATLHSFADGAALHVAAENSVGDILVRTEEAIVAQLGMRVETVDVSGQWLDDRRYRVTITASVSTTFMRAIPFMPETIELGVVSVAGRTPPTYVTTPPERSLLDPEAGDYNRIYMYCFDPENANVEQRDRSGLTPIADNGTPPTDYSNRALPECGPGEAVSYMLRNVRGARSNRGKWDRATEEVYEYYADARIDPETERVTHDVRGFRVGNGQRRTALDMSASPILETILCETAEACRPAREGGVIPNRKTGRTPNVEQGACVAGKYMYFGWEDRPPGFGWTDTDYDDIRLVVSCPEIRQVSGREVVLVQ